MQPLKGIALKLVSLSVFIAMASLIKAASETVPPGQAVFFRSLFAIPVIVLVLGWQGNLRTGFRTKRPWAHLFRGVMGTTTMALGFAGLARLPLPEVTAIGYAAPVLMVIFAALFLRETVRLVRLGAVALGLAGVMVVVWPRLSLLSDDPGSAAGIGAILVLTGAVTAALTQVYVRTLVRVEAAPTIVFYFSVTATLLSLLTAPFGWVWPGPQLMVMLVAAGVLGGIGQMCLTMAYQYADVSVVAPFEYSSILLAIASGYFFFSEVPTLQTLLGAALVTLAGLLIVWREHQLGLKRGQARAQMPR